MNSDVIALPASPSNSRDNPCFSTDATIATLNVMADDHRSHQLPYAQFLHAVRMANPALEEMPDAPAEKMVLRFSQAEVVLLGSGLRAIERSLQKYELKFVKAADPRFTAALKTHLASVSISFTQEAS